MSFSVFSSRVLHDGQFLAAFRRRQGSAAPAPAQRERHPLHPVQLFPVQPWRPQPWGPAGLYQGQWGLQGQRCVECVGFPGPPVAPSGACCQHFLAQWIPGKSLCEVITHTNIHVEIVMFTYIYMICQIWWRCSFSWFKGSENLVSHILMPAPWCRQYLYNFSESWYFPCSCHKRTCEHLHLCTLS